MTTIPLFPIQIPFQQWAAQIRLAYPDLFFPLPLPDKEWRFWAAQVVIGNALSQHVYPTALAFPTTEDWKKWAAFFLNNI